MCFITVTALRHGRFTSELEGPHVGGPSQMRYRRKAPPNNSDFLVIETHQKGQGDLQMYNPPQYPTGTHTNYVMYSIRIYTHIYILCMCVYICMNIASVTSSPRCLISNIFIYIHNPTDSSSAVIFTS